MSLPPLTPVSRPWSCAAARTLAVAVTPTTFGRARGELRAVHLRAHLETAAVLSAEQTAAYVRMRGYGG